MNYCVTSTYIYFFFLTALFPAPCGTDGHVSYELPFFYRTVLLRLASLGVLMIKIYAKVDETCEDNPETCCQQVRSLCAFDQIVVVVALINITEGLLVSGVTV